MTNANTLHEQIEALVKERRALQVKIDALWEAIAHLNYGIPVSDYVAIEHQTDEATVLRELDDIEAYKLRMKYLIKV